MFTLRATDAGGVARTVSIQLGAAGDLPVVGDWNGDGLGDLGVWSPATAVFTQGRTLSPLTAAPAAARLEVSTVQFGQPRG
ncbi:hypothetical protein [Nocardioides piscis]|uniref:hypothetical protein n=1 Tax=Nocardioides piscis TaxID=2714938 RepID=UPI0014088F7A|nr:hypothetical protein [Nocardioides piscis]